MFFKEVSFNTIITLERKEIYVCKKSIAPGLMTFNIMVRDTEKEVLELKEMLHKPKKNYILT